MNKMLTKKYIGTALACVLALGTLSGSAPATPTNVGGILIDPSSPLDLNIQAINFRETTVFQVGDTLMGYGEIGSINGTGASTFCVNATGCSLNFTFQYTVANIDTTGSNPHVVFDNGMINFFVDNTQSFSVLDPTTAGIGTPWLSLNGHTAPYSGFSYLGQLYSSIDGTISNPTSGSSGFGLLDATGGPAAYFTNTNSIADGIGGFADFSLDSSFQYQPAGICSGETCYPISGEGSLLGSSLTVPEPGAAGLLGLGLAFLGLFIRRRRHEANEAA